MTTFPILLTTLPVGSQIFGPVTVSDADSSIKLTIDRTVVAGLNAATSDTTVTAAAQMSLDGGTTWQATDSDQPGTITQWTAIGGPITYTDKQGVSHIYTESSGTWFLFPGTSRKLRATITVAGPLALAVAGSIITS